MSDQSTVEKQQRGEAADAAIKAAIASERRRCIDRVLTYAALRDQAAVNLDRAPREAERGSGGACANAGGGGARHSRFLGRGDASLIQVSEWKSPDFHRTFR
jgi:hypothetical protein